MLALPLQDVLERACTRYAIELDQCLDQRIEAQARLVAILRSLPDCQQKLEMQKVPRRRHAPVLS